MSLVPRDLVVAAARARRAAEEYMGGSDGRRVEDRRPRQEESTGRADRASPVLEGADEARAWAMELAARGG